MPKEFAEHVRLMMDMLVLAFQTDSTRIATFMYANEGSNRSYPEIGVRAGHHELSHHGREPEKQAKISKINRFHLGLLADFLQKLQAIKEGDGTLLESAMIVYGSGISDGNRHNHDDLPILLAGEGGGTIRAGRHLRYPKETPLTNLYLAMLDRMGVPMAKFSDSTGKLERAFLSSCKPETHTQRRTDWTTSPSSRPTPPWRPRQPRRPRSARR